MSQVQTSITLSQKSKKAAILMARKSLRTFSFFIEYLVIKEAVAQRLITPKTAAAAATFGLTSTPEPPPSARRPRPRKSRTRTAAPSTP